MTLYRIGGGDRQRARAFIVDDVEGWDTISMHGILTSSDAASDDLWGDYGGVSRFDGCSNT